MLKQVYGTNDLTLWIDLTKVSSIALFDDGTSYLSVVGVDRAIRVEKAEAQRLIAIINDQVVEGNRVGFEYWMPNTPENEAKIQRGFDAFFDAINGAAPAPGRGDQVARIERDQFYSKTSGGYRAMWRCTTVEGMSFNIFDHADPLRNTFKLFADQGYAELLQGMVLGEVYTFTGENTFQVLLAQDGDFWKPITVAENPGIKPQPPENDLPADDPEDEDDEDA